MPSRQLIDRLNWQVAVNNILRDHDYESGVFGAVRDDDFHRMDAAVAAGETPEDFAHAILQRDGFFTPMTSAQAGAVA